MATIKDYKLNPPKKKSDLDRISMLSYAKENGTKEQMIAFIKADKECKKNAKRPWDNPEGKWKKGDIYETPDIKKLRNEFLKIFKNDFPQLNKKKESVKSVITPDDIIKQMEEEIAKAE
jgi:hypothetical protein